MFSELASGLTGKFSFYLQSAYLFGKLIQGMTLNDPEYFTYDQYPLLQPNMSEFTNLWDWGVVENKDTLPAYLAELKSKLKALNYFADQFFTLGLEDIPVYSI